MREGIRAFVPVVLGRGAYQLSGYLDVFLSSFLAAGALAALGYAQTLYLLPISLFGMSVAASELPELSRISRAQLGAFLERVRGSLSQILYLVIPTVVGYFAFGYLVVGVLYRTGRFGTDDNWLVYFVLAAYTLGLAATTASRLLQNAFYALDDTKTPARIAIWRVVISAIVGTVLMFLFDRLSVLEVLGVPARRRAAAARRGRAGAGLGRWRMDRAVAAGPRAAPAGAGLLAAVGPRRADGRHRPRGRGASGARLLLRAIGHRADLALRRGRARDLRGRLPRAGPRARLPGGRGVDGALPAPVQAVVAPEASGGGGLWRGRGSTATRDAPSAPSLRFFGLTLSHFVAGYKGHIAGAAVVTTLYLGGLAALFAVDEAYRQFSEMEMVGWAAVLLGIGLMFGLWPDVDTNSKGQNLFYWLFFLTDIALIGGQHFREAAYLGLFCILPVIGKHRGWTHTKWAMLVVPAPLVLVPMLLFADQEPLAGLPFYGAAVAGYFSHLLMDGLIVPLPWKKRRSGWG